MKNNFEKITPNFLISLFKNIKRNYFARKMYTRDRIRFRKAAFSLTKNLDESNLIGMIVFYYHSIEKGLCQIDFRKGFGKTAIDGLISSINLYNLNNYDKENIQYITGISVLYRYIEKHEDLGYDVLTLKDFLKNNNLLDGKNGGMRIYNGIDISSKGKFDFNVLSQTRHSVRNFGSQPVDKSKIFEAINISIRTPSVCNRQPWKVHLIRNKDLLMHLLDIQGGFKGFGKNIDSLIIVTSDLKKLSNIFERNQGFVDSGMFSMSILYALHYQGIASCALNANFDFERENKIRKLVAIPENQTITVLIAIGSYPETFASPVSQRNSLFDVLTIYEE